MNKEKIMKAARWASAVLFGAGFIACLVSFTLGSLDSTDFRFLETFVAFWR